MTTLDTLLHVVEHAKRWGISDHPVKQFSANAAQVAFLLPDDHIELFVQWARNLERASITGMIPGSIGALKVKGQILSGHTIEVSVLLDGLDMRFNHLMGALSLGEVEQYARRAAVA